MAAEYYDQFDECFDKFFTKLNKHVYKLKPAYPTATRLTSPTTRPSSARPSHGRKSIGFFPHPTELGCRNLGVDTRPPTQCVALIVRNKSACNVHNSDFSLFKKTIIVVINEFEVVVIIRRVNYINSLNLWPLFHCVS